MSDVNNVDWLLGQIYDGKVGLGPDHRYGVTVSASKPPVDCDPQVYWLDDDGLVTLVGETVEPSEKGKRHRAIVARVQREAQAEQRRAARTVTFQTAGQAA